MKLIWHIILKDIRRDRWALGLWASLFLGQGLVGLAALHPGAGFEQEHFLHLQLGSMGMVALQAVMGYVLVARFVQADGLIGTTAFWLTRPISRARLLLAKGLGVLLVFGWLPVLLLLPWWLYCGFGSRDIFWCAIDTFGWQLLVIAPAFLVAALTDDLGRVLLWSLLLVIALFSWIVLLQASFGPLSGRVGWKGISPGVIYTKLWLSAVLFAVGAGTIAVHQYLTRHFLRSVGLVVGCMGLVAATGQWSRADLSRTVASLPRATVAPVQGVADKIDITVESVRGHLSRDLNARARRMNNNAPLQLLLRANGLPEGLNIETEWAEQSWAWPDGVKLTRGARFSRVQSVRPEALRRLLDLPVPQIDPETDRWDQRRAAEVREKQRNQGTWSYVPQLLPTDVQGLLYYRNSVPDSFFAKMQAQAPAYQVNLRCVVLRPEMVAELPVRQASRARADGESFHFIPLGADDEALILTHPSFTMAGLWFSGGIGDAGHGSLLRRRGVLQVNRVTGDIVEGRGWRASSMMMIGGVSVYWNRFDLKSPKLIRDGQTVEKDPQWREHTFLVVMADREIARFDRVVSTDKLMVDMLPVEP